MFFLLYALGVVVLLAGLIAGLALSSIAIIYGATAFVLAAGISYLKRSSTPEPPELDCERRKQEDEELLRITIRQ